MMTSQSSPVINKRPASSLFIETSFLHIVREQRKCLETFSEKSSSRSYGLILFSLFLHSQFLFIRPSSSFPSSCLLLLALFPLSLLVSPFPCHNCPPETRSPGVSLHLIRHFITVMSVKLILRLDSPFATELPSPCEMLLPSGGQIESSTTYQLTAF